MDPYKGYYARVVQEFAGIGGDTVFGKAEIHSALYHQIWNNLVNNILHVYYPDDVNNLHTFWYLPYKTCCIVYVCFTLSVFCALC